MKKQEAYKIGYILKTHGLKGGISASFDMSNPQEYILSDALFVEVNNALVPYFIETLNVNQGKGFIKFEDLNNVEEAKKLIGLELYIPLADLPQLEDGEFYFHEIIGFTIHDQEVGLLGKVEEVIDLKSHAVMRTTYQGKEVLIPMHEEVLLETDKDAEQLKVQLPDGLLDVYLSE
ncbi:MAG: ribosome maturation factor RimM [Flammeovirgaceae bacterium]